MISDYIIGLQSGFENKINYLIEYYNNHFYDFCIKYESEHNKTFYYKDEYLLFYKYIPLCIFNNLPFIIGEQNIINIEELKEEILQYINLGYDIENLLHISKNAVLNFKNSNYKIDTIENDKLLTLFEYFFPNIVDFEKILKGKQMLIFESSKGVYDIDNNKYNKLSEKHLH